MEGGQEHSDGVELLGAGASGVSMMCVAGGSWYYAVRTSRLPVIVTVTEQEQKVQGLWQ